MKRFLPLMIVSVALLGAQIGSAQSPEFKPEMLSLKARIASGKLAKACVFSVGGVGYGGQTSNQELALYDLLEDPYAVEALRSLVETASFEGGLYGLIGLSIKDHREFNRSVEIYQARRERPEQKETRSLECTALAVTDLTVVTQSGCIIEVEQRDKIVRAIQSGRYDRLLNVNYRPRNE